MQIAAEVRRGHARNPRGVKIGDFKLEFVGQKSKAGDGKMTAERASALAKAKWVSMMTRPIRRETRPADALENVTSPNQ